MLEGLDSIDWSSLTHAHGPADDVPKLLRSLLSKEADVRLQACADLHETIWHQGTVYSASAAVVPFLLDLLNVPELDDPGCVVSLLTCIATGTGSIQYGIRVDGEQTMQSRLARQGRSLEEAIAEERTALESIHRTVSAGLRKLLPYLSEGEGLGAAVAETLGRFPEHAAWLAPAIEEAIGRESDEHVRQVLAESRTRLTNASIGGYDPVV